MIFFSNEKFNEKAKSEVEKIYSKISSELLDVPSYMISTYYKEENNKTISCSPVFDNNKNLIGHSLSIKNNNNNQYIYAISCEEMFELILVDNNENTCEKYKVELEDNDLISTRSIFVGDDYLKLKRNITKDEIDLSGTILNYIVAARNFLKDDMDYLKYCFAHYNLSCKNKKRVKL